jgi:hypothetical protein
VVLMGDSVLDNYYWLEDPATYLRPDLEKELKQELGEEWRCINLAVDETSTFDFHKRTPGQHGWRRYERGRERVFGQGDPQDQQYYPASDGALHSLFNLRQLRNVKAVVVSVGGNDVYLQESIQRALALSVLPWKRHVGRDVGDQFGQRLRLVLQGIRDAAPGALIVPVVVYHPHYEYSIAGLNSGLIGALAKLGQRALLSTATAPMIKQFLRLAREDHLPVIDLSRTLDPCNYAHYGTGAPDASNSLGAPWSGAEPSNMSSHFIAQLVCHVVDQHVQREAHAAQSSSSASVVYYGEPLHATSDVLVKIHREVNDVEFEANYRFGTHGCACRSPDTQHETFYSAPVLAEGIKSARHA